MCKCCGHYWWSQTQLCFQNNEVSITSSMEITLREERLRKKPACTYILTLHSWGSHFSWSCLSSDI
ncbi:hypothetical protein RHGRI_035768 [Rhododendron griersonianum]|uniref:Uncharacterized protein n=1 Tax=Rhododendron griersonianum TaxID=479676 RepID=A0AAV6HKE5_9ERIC|nr:hypothetical protein RHGRI_035768 [Rhododendron griersonianum]